MRNVPLRKTILKTNAQRPSVIKKPATILMTTHKINTFFDYWVNVAETP